MKILATKPESLIEWPNHLSFVIFIAGCNFRCPFCYVPHLVREESYSKINGISEQEIIDQIEKRKNFIDAVCITGGEPTTHPELKLFLQKLKEKGLKIRLETNGSNPRFLKELIDNNLIDSVALDIKNSKEKYNQTISSQINVERIDETLKLIKNIDYEVRMTMVPDLHLSEDVKLVAARLKEKGINKLVLNQFKSNLPRQQTLNPEFMKKPNYPLQDMEKIKSEIKSVDIEIRN